MSEACAHHRHDTGLGTDDLRVALGEAEARCVRRGERMTEPRRRVLELLLASGELLRGRMTVMGKDPVGDGRGVVIAQHDLLDEDGRLVFSCLSRTLLLRR